MILLLAAPAAMATYVAVSTADALSAAITAAAPGDEIVIANGSYADWKITAEGSGAEGTPIIVRPASAGGVTLTGAPKLRIQGKYIEIHDLTFEGCRISKAHGAMILFDGAQHCRVTGSRLLKTRLEGSTCAVDIIHRASDNRFDHNRIIDIRTRSLRIVIDEDSVKNGPPARNRIDHNLFQDVPPIDGNGGETIQIGSQAKPFSNVEPQTLVDHNLFIRCNGEAEIISCKTSHNSFIGNVFKDCDGELVLRHCKRVLIKDNWFEGGSGAIRMHGPQHTVTGNMMVRCATGIVMSYGTTAEANPASYLPVKECLIANNTFVDCGLGIYMGFLKGTIFYNEKWARAPWFASDTFSCTVAPRDNIIANNIFTGKRGIMLQIDECSEGPRQPAASATLAKETVSAPDNMIENNLYFASGDARTGELGKGSIEADPMFKNPATGDYSLAGKSPALRAAKQHAGVTLPDIGAVGCMPPAGPDFAE